MKPIVDARIRKWPPKGDRIVHFRILCGKEFSNGQYCPKDLGMIKRLYRRKGSDPHDPRSYVRTGVVPTGPGGISHRGVGEMAPEMALVFPDEPYAFDLDDDGWEGLWYAVCDIGYYFDETAHDFKMIRIKKLGLSGANATRRRMTDRRAIALENRVDPYRRYDFSAEYVQLGGVPVLPATITCKCGTPNYVRRPSDLGF